MQAPTFTFKPACPIVALLKIIAFFVVTVVVGCLLAPPLYWAAHAIEPWAIANGLLRLDPKGNEVVARGTLSFLASDFQKFFNRSVLIAALVFLWPTARWLGIGKVSKGLMLKPDPRWRAHLLWGLVLGGGAVALMAAAYLQLDIYKLKSTLPWSALPKLALSAVVVALLEEALFRGAIMGLFLRSLYDKPALFCTTVLFAVLHFLKPDDSVELTKVHWYSGFELLPHTFHQFAEPLQLLAGFTTLFVLGWLLGYARLRTSALWLPIGLHAGVVFVKMGFSKFTKRQDEHLPWVGDQLQIGIVPCGVLLLVLLLVWVVTRHAAKPATAAGQPTPAA